MAQMFGVFPQKKHKYITALVIMMNLLFLQITAALLLAEVTQQAN